jgi:hypothetical protein
MRLSISAVSGNRKFTKALVKHSQRIDSLRNSAVGISTDSMPFDTLQIIFLDRDQSYLRPVGCKKDRIFQVEVATPDEQDIDYSDETSLFRAIAGKLLVALKSTNLSETEKDDIALAIQTVASAE